MERGERIARVLGASTVIELLPLAIRWKHVITVNY